MFALKRDPALTATAIATGIRLLAAFAFNLNENQQALLNAVVVAAAAAWVAFAVRREGQVPAVLGLAQALLALALGFGLEVNPELQAMIMSFVGLIVSMFIRTQVVAPVPARA